MFISATLEKWSGSAQFKFLPHYQLSYSPAFWPGSALK